MTALVRHLTCCVCGDYAGRWQQWHNRDTGFGVCTRCIAWLRSPRPSDGLPRESEDEIGRLYGRQGVHWGDVASQARPVHQGETR